MKDLIPILVAFLAAAGSITVAFINGYQNRKMKRMEIDAKTAKSGEVVARVALRLVGSLWFQAFIHRQAHELFETTAGGRFLMLVAVNGKTDYNIVNGYFECYADEREVGEDTFRDVIIDAHYKQMLKDIERHFFLLLDTESLPPDSLLYGIYKNAGVRHVVACYLGRIKADEENEAVVFFTIASFDKEFENLSLIRLVQSRIKSKMNEIKFI